MAIKIGNTDISAFKVGSGDCKIYLGDTLLYPTTPSFDVKWLATYSDSYTESAACDSTSAITQNEINKLNLVSVEIGQCVTSIGQNAFAYCDSLTSCTIGSGVTSIGGSAFYICTGLTSVLIPDSVTSIGSAAFWGCSGLTSVTIGSGVTSIGYGAFRECSGLTGVTVEATTPPTLENFVFYNTNDCPIYVPCESLEAYKTAWSTYTDRIQCKQPSFDGKWLASYSDSHTESAACDSTSAITGSEIEKPNLVDMQIGQCVTIIGFGAFRGCGSLTSVTIGSGVTSIGNNVFEYCRSLSSITMPNSVTSIGNSAFYNCSRLTSCTIGSGVTSIGNSAFNSCINLKSVDIPSGVTIIGQYVFASCSGLTSITVEAVTPPTLGDYAFNNTNNCPIYVPDVSVNTYKSASGWSDYASRIQAKP